MRFLFVAFSFSFLSLPVFAAEDYGALSCGVCGQDVRFQSEGKEIVISQVHKCYVQRSTGALTVVGRQVRMGSDVMGTTHTLEQDVKGLSGLTLVGVTLPDVTAEAFEIYGGSVVVLKDTNLNHLSQGTPVRPATSVSTTPSSTTPVSSSETTPELQADSLLCQRTRHLISEWATCKNSSEAEGFPGCPRNSAWHHIRQTGKAGSFTGVGGSELFVTGFGVQHWQGAPIYDSGDVLPGKGTTSLQYSAFLDDMRLCYCSEDSQACARYNNACKENCDLGLGSQPASVDAQQNLSQALARLETLIASSAAQQVQHPHVGWGRSQAERNLTRAEEKVSGMQWDEAIDEDKDFNHSRRRRFCREYEDNVEKYFEAITLAGCHIALLQGCDVLAVADVEAAQHGDWCEEQVRPSREDNSNQALAHDVRGVVVRERGKLACLWHACQTALGSYISTLQ